MFQNYQVISAKQNIRKLFRPNSEQLLAVGIMDTGSAEDLISCTEWYVHNFNHCLHVITTAERMEANSLNVKFPEVNFIVFERSPLLGQRVNAMANECQTTYFYLTRTDIETVAFNWEIIYSIFKDSEHTAVITPLVFNKNQELMPTVATPTLDKKGINPVGYCPSVNNDKNLYPFLGLGVYDRALYQRLRGYDCDIAGAFWQELDFGVRCWLYGYEILSTNFMAIIFPYKQSLVEDRSECKGIERFYTKALGIEMKHNGVPKITKGYKTDKHILLTEVKQKSALYKTDFQTLCAFWKAPQEEKQV